MLPPFHNAPSLQKRQYRSSYYYYSNDPTVTAILCTIFTILLTIGLEIAIHVLLSPSRQKKGDAEDPASGSVPEQPPVELSDQLASSPTKSTESKPSSLASPQVRGLRLAVAMVLYPIILTLFIVRMVDGSGPFGFFAVIIVPFTCATFALFRALVDCILVRFNTGLCTKFRGGGWPWMPFMPFSMLVPCLFEVGRLFAEVIMGEREWPTWMNETGRWRGGAREEIAIQGDETWGLVGNDDGAEEGSEDGDEQNTDGPPDYDEAVGSKKLVERRIEEDDTA